MTKTYKKTLLIDEDIHTVWRFLTEPEYTKKYMYNSSIISSWIIGESFSWQGEYEGEKVLTEGSLLAYIPKTHFKFSELKNGILDEIVTYSLESVESNKTKVSLVAQYFGDDFDGYQKGWDEIVIKNLIQLIRPNPKNLFTML